MARVKLAATFALGEKNAKRKREEMCYKNTENAPNIDFNRIPRQNTHSHIILKLRSPNYYYVSMNNNVAMKTTISDNINKTAMIFKQMCDAVITSYPINIFSTGTLFTNVNKIIDQHDRLFRYPRLFKKFSRMELFKQRQIVVLYLASTSLGTSVLLCNSVVPSVTG